MTAHKIRALDMALSSVREWRRDATCVRLGLPELWFPDSGDIVGIGVLTACASCPVRRNCLTYALTHGITDGVWAGLTAAELSRLRTRIDQGWPLEEAASTALTVARARAVDGTRVKYRPSPEDDRASYRIYGDTGAGLPDDDYGGCGEGSDLSVSARPPAA